MATRIPLVVTLSIAGLFIGASLCASLGTVYARNAQTDQITGGIDWKNLPDQPRTTPSPLLGSDPFHIAKNDSGAFGENEVAIIVAVIAVFIGIGIWLYGRILNKAGYSRWWVLVLLVPIVNIVMFWVFAFANWPNLESVSNEKKQSTLVSGQDDVINRSGWWRSKSRIFRIWVFSSSIWIVLVFLFVLIFDPFNNGEWRYMNGDEYTKMFFVMAIPILAGGLTYLYEKLVK